MGFSLLWQRFQFFLHLFSVCKRLQQFMSFPHTVLYCQTSRCFIHANHEKDSYFNIYLNNQCKQLSDIMLSLVKLLHIYIYKTCKEILMYERQQYQHITLYYQTYCIYSWKSPNFKGSSFKVKFKKSTSYTQYSSKGLNSSLNLRCHSLGKVNYYITDFKISLFL